MDETPNLKLPYLIAAQAQKHVTHNEALRALDALVQLSVLDRDVTEPPAAPADGERYIIAANATGAWAGHDSEIAAFQDNAWVLYPPQPGWRAFVQDEEKLLTWNGSQWSDVSGGGSINPALLVGVNTTADATNRLAVKSDAILLSHDDVTPGNGSLQLKLNKETSAKTAAVLFQNSYAGHAELGLCGDDNLHLKVSPDGVTWHDGLIINKGTGTVSMPNTADSGGRPTLTENRTYFVRTDGSDSNDGLTNAVGGAFLTIQKAINVVATLDIGTYNVTISVADGTYSGGSSVVGAWLGSGTVTLTGNSANPQNCIISTTSANCISLNSGARLNIGGFTFQTATSGSAISVANGAIVTLNAKCRFGACATYHLAVASGGRININADYEITGGALYHWNATTMGGLSCLLRTVTLTGTPAFSISFAYAGRLGGIDCHLNTFSGAATGTRYVVEGNGVVFTNAAGASYLPGSAAGSSATGGQYI